MNTNNCDKVQIPHQTRRIKPTRRSVSGSFAFRKQTAIPFESTLERDFLIRKSFSPLVVDIIPQPVQLEYTANNGRTYRYTPDFLVYFRSVNYANELELKPLLVEVKYRDELREKWQDLHPKFKAALRYAKEQGWDFRIYDETRIRDQVLTNIVSLKRYKNMAFPPEETAAILNHLTIVGQAPFSQLVASQFAGKWDTATGIAHVWHLVTIGLIECDMTIPLSNNTVVWRSIYGQI